MFIRTNGKKSYASAGVDLVVAGAVGVGASKLKKVLDKVVKQTTKVVTQTSKVAVKTAAKAVKVVRKTGGYGVKATAAKQVAKDASSNAAYAYKKKAAAVTVNKLSETEGASVIKEAVENKTSETAKAVLQIKK